MANVAIAFVPIVTPFAFDTSPIGGNYLNKTALPRARICFRLNAGVVAAKVGGNTQSLTVACSLPPNFAYTLEYVSAHIAVDECVNYSDIGFLSTTLGDGQGIRLSEMFSDGISVFAPPSSILETKMYAPVNKFPMPIYNDQGNTPAMDIALFDNEGTNSTSAGTLSALACFLQYDIEQVYNVGINYPVPVQLR